MMASPAVIGLSAGKRLLTTSFCPSDISEKLFGVPDHGSLPFPAAPSKTAIVAQKSSHFGANPASNRQGQVIKALRQPVHTSAASATDDWWRRPDMSKNADPDFESSLEVLVLLQKSMLEKQWELPFDESMAIGAPGERTKKVQVIRSGISARQRRTNVRRKVSAMPIGAKNVRFTVSPELLQTRNRGYMKGTVSEELLSHAEVVHLSKKIKAGLLLEEHRSKLKQKLGIEPSDKQLAFSLKLSRAELYLRIFECSLARERLAMSNVRLVMSIAQRYDNLGAELSDLIQGGLIGLLRGIEKFDSSKGFKISTYVYWWIRQGVSRALVENSKTLRLPNYLHERLSLIRNAKNRLEERGIAPSIDKLAESLNMSPKKVRNATEAVSKVLSLDREAFPSLNGVSGDTLHSYVADRNLGNNPWHGFDEWSVKDEVNQLLHSVLTKRERDIIRLYHGLGRECHTWEDISRQFGLSRERVRQVGLVAMEKLKHAARKKRLEAMLVKH